MLDQLHVYDDPEPRSAALNMALDETFLENADAPLLRFYRWRGPSLSFGYFGCYAEVANQSSHREIVRRWTGGGIVPHGDDLTYSIVLPASHPSFALSSPEIYAELHEAIRLSLLSNGVEAVLASSAGARVSETCFANPVRADVISNGEKIAGAAHRRTRAGLLHQGSIQRGDLPGGFRADLARHLCDRFERKEVSPGVLARAAEVAKAKYGTDEWLRLR